jgi:predicted RNase H-like nuclease (RuvC/YqgF family)
MREVRDYLLADLTHLIENEEAGPAYAKWAFNKLEKLVPALKLYHEDGLRQIKEVIVANPDAECLKDISRAIDGVIEVVDNQRMTLEKMWQVQTEREQLKADQEQLRAEQKQLRAAQAQLKADQEQMKARESELETKISNAVADAVANIEEVASGEVEFRVYRATRRMM